MEDLKNNKLLEKDEMDLYVASGAKVAAIAIGIYEIPLPIRLTLVLNICYYVLVIYSNIILVSVLDK